MIRLKSLLKKIKISENKKINNWENKYVIVFGDSIVAGQELVREETPYRDIVYAKLASYQLKAYKFDNFAETGTGQFKGQNNLDKRTGWIHSFEGTIKHYASTISNADVALIAYGNNDWKQPNADGQLHTLDRVKEKLKNNIEYLRQINKKIQLIGVLETQAFRNKQSVWSIVGPNGFSYGEMVNAYSEVYQELNVPIFDIRTYGIGNSIEEYVDHRDHFTKETHCKIAEALSDFVCHGYNDKHLTI